MSRLVEAAIGYEFNLADGVDVARHEVRLPRPFKGHALLTEDPAELVLVESISIGVVEQLAGTAAPLQWFNGGHYVDGAVFGFLGLGFAAVDDVESTPEERAAIVRLHNLSSYNGVRSSFDGAERGRVLAVAIRRVRPVGALVLRAAIVGVAIEVA